jgi:hypothetical protein
MPWELSQIVPLVLFLIEIIVFTLWFLNVKAIKG